MRVLILGSGAREHALGLVISRSPQCSGIFFAPGNPGTSRIGVNFDIEPTDFEAVANIIQTETIQLVVVGPEGPLVEGISDYLKSKEYAFPVGVIGPDKAGAKLEGSKEFAKAFMQKYDIPTARYGSFSLSSITEGRAFLGSMSAPYVLKADGLAAGKGVVICNNPEEANAVLDDMLVHRRFGVASEKVVIEEFLNGIEISMFVLTDGVSYLLLPEAKDYKRIGENDTGPNTGGMGAVSPVPFADAAFLAKVDQRIIKPTLIGLQKEGIPYCGFIFFGLMCVDGDPLVIEYNVRMGDPETEAILLRIESDFLSHLVATANGTLASESIRVSQSAAATIVIASGGYPGEYETGFEVAGIQDINKSEVFFAGLKGNPDLPVTMGGRVMAISSIASNLQHAVAASYESAKNIRFQNMYYRRDIGLDLMQFLP